MISQLVQKMAAFPMASFKSFIKRDLLSTDPETRPPFMRVVIRCYTLKTVFYDITTTIELTKSHCLTSSS